MTRLIISFVFSFAILLQFGFSSGTKTADKSPSYVGVKTCGMCHKSEKQGNLLQRPNLNNLKRRSKQKKNKADGVVP